jgi:hypothetical protein
MKGDNLCVVAYFRQTLAHNFDSAHKRLWFKCGKVQGAQACQRRLKIAAVHRLICMANGILDLSHDYLCS